jgi:hypothetical protein
MLHEVFSYGDAEKGTSEAVFIAKALAYGVWGHASRPAILGHDRKGGDECHRRWSGGL